MSIELFQYNEKAYKAAVKMLKMHKKAAIIHPTGTAKFFIGFKLCEDNPDSIICWLSPSDYIFKTQLENLKDVTNGYVPKNVRFFTYSKLTYLTDNELKAISPNYIILDEFHRCGAEIWGQSVQNLLSLYPDVPVLGLSATNIRYLDNCRNVSDELFDNNIASEITLGEAIVKGILPAPKYITALYSYSKDFEKYEKRVLGYKSPGQKENAEKYLEALRRAIQESEGLDEIFYKHIQNMNSKYIVFCANKEHMDEMISHIGDWFCKIDNAPNVYRAYSNDPEASKEFSEFKSDKSEHLKLIFCIDMLKNILKKMVI